MRRDAIAADGSQRERKPMGDHLSPNQKRLLAQILGQDEEKLEEGTYSLVFTEYSRARLGELHKYDDERYQIRAARKGPWQRCPGCERLVLEKELTKKGCYICGWKPK